MRGLAVTKTRSQCKLVNDGVLSMDAATTAVLSERFCSSSPHSSSKEEERRDLRLFLYFYLASGRDYDTPAVTRVKHRLLHQ